MDYEIKLNLKKILKKLSKKDKASYEQVIKKIQEIINSENIEHYKNLRYSLKEFKRVRIKGPFILIFQYLESEGKIVFYDFDHHDEVYKKSLD